MIIEGGGGGAVEIATMRMCVYVCMCVRERERFGISSFAVDVESSRSEYIKECPNSWTSKFAFPTPETRISIYPPFLSFPRV
jgi:hypothetical protein